MVLGRLHLMIDVGRCLTVPSYGRCMIQGKVVAPNKYLKLIGRGVLRGIRKIELNFQSSRRHKMRLDSEGDGVRLEVALRYNSYRLPIDLER